MLHHEKRLPYAIHAYCFSPWCGMLGLKYLGGLESFQQEFSHAQWLADHD